MNCKNCGKEIQAGIRFCGHCGLPVAENTPAPAGTEGSDPAVIDPMLGRLVLNQYRILRRIGGGGMGTAYLAEQIGMDRLAVVKVLHPHLLGDALWVERFNREAKVASKLSHPNSITLYNYGRTDEGYAFIAMEYVDGRNLSEVVQTDAPIEPQRAVAIATQICGALQQAHELGIVHRDLKSENILLTERGRREVAKVLDFGIAKMQGAGPDEPQLTATGMVFGTPAYMSPEQFTGSQLDGRSDLYSLAIIVYEMLTGRRPFSATSPIGYFRLHQDTPAPPLRVSNPAAGVSLALDKAVLRGLEKEPSRRYEDAEAMAEALQQALKQPDAPAASVGEPSDDTEDAFPRLQRDDEVAAWLDSFESSAGSATDASGGGGGTFLDRLEAAGGDPLAGDGAPAGGMAGSAGLAGGPSSWSDAESSPSLPKIGPDELALIVDEPPEERSSSLSAEPRSSTSAPRTAPRGPGKGGSRPAAKATAPPAGRGSLSVASDDDLLVVGREPLTSPKPTSGSRQSRDSLPAASAAEGGRRSAARRNRVSLVPGRSSGRAVGTAQSRGRDSLPPESNSGLRRSPGAATTERPRTLAGARSAASPEHARRLARRSLVIKIAILAGVFTAAVAAAYLSPLGKILQGALSSDGGGSGSTPRGPGDGPKRRGDGAHTDQDMASIPGGAFEVGDPGVKGARPYGVELRPFLIDRHEVSNTRYRVCVVAGHCFQPAFWSDGRFAGPLRPVVGVSLEEAKAYCAFRGLRLPYASEWERAARGPDGHRWPWGKSFVQGSANLAGSGDGAGLTADVGAFPEGASPEGVTNLIGNAAEWVLADPPEYQPRRRPGKPRSEWVRAPSVRGGSFVSEPENAAAPLPGEVVPTSSRRFNIGFRCARDAAEAPSGGGSD